MGRTPVNWLADKYKKIGEHERPMICGDIKPLRLLFPKIQENQILALA
jgi:hypothetical protein